MANVVGTLLCELGINTAAFHGGLDKATYAAKQFGGELRNSFSQLSSSFSQLGSTLGAQFGPLGGIIGSLTQGVGALGSAIKTAGSNVPALMQVAGAAAGIGGAAIAAAAGLTALSISGSHLADELIRNSEKLGVTVTQMASLKYLAEYTDLPVQALVRGFARFAKSIGDIGEKVTPATSLLKQLGVQAGTGTYEGLGKAMKGIRDMEDPVQRMNAATALFGMRLGLQLLPALEDSSVSLETFSKMAKDAGVDLDANAIKSTREWKLATTELSASWDGLKLSFANMDWVKDEIRGLSMLVQLATEFAHAKAGASKQPFAEGPKEHALSMEAMGGAAVSDEALAEARAEDAKSAKDAADATQQEAAATEDAHKSAVALAHAAEDHFKALKAGGPAGEHLRELEDQIKEAEEGAAQQTGAKAVALWNQAYALEGQLERAKELAEVEKKNADTMSNNERRAADIEKERNEHTNAILESLEKETEEATRQSAEAAKLRNEWIDIHDEFKKAAEAQKKAGEANKTAGIEQGLKAQQEALAAQHSLGLISEKSYATQLIKIYNEERDAKLASLKEQIATQQTKAVAPESNIEEQNAAKLKAIQLTGELGKVTADYTAKINAERVALLQNPFTAFIKSTKDVKTALEENIVKAMEQVNNSIARTVVTGKDLGKAMKSVAQGIAESMIEMCLKMLEKWVITHLIMGTVAKATAASNAVAQVAADKVEGVAAAGLAGANAVASFAAAPWPIDMGAPAFGAAMFANAMTFAAFEKGGLIPGRGPVPIIGHGGEMVLPRPISEKVQKMADPDIAMRGGKGRGGRGTNVTMNIVTPDADSFRHSQSQIHAKQHLSATKMAARNG